MCFSVLDLSLLQSKAAMDPLEGPSNGQANGEQSKSQAVSFSVGFGEPAKKKMPKHFRSKRKPELSEADIAEKQRLAEKRRKVRHE